MAEMIASDIQPIQNLRVLQYVGEKKAEWGKHWIETGFKGIYVHLTTILGRVLFHRVVSDHCVCAVGLEAYLQQTAKKYCVGDEVTVNH